MAEVYGPYPALVVGWRDADTLRLNLDLGFGIILSAFNIAGKAVLSCRVFGIDSPELATAEGKAALAFAAELCPPGTRVMLASHSWDKYGGRYDGTITLPDGRDLAAVLTEAGHARPYTGSGPKPWLCGPLGALACSLAASSPVTGAGWAWEAGPPEGARMAWGSAGQPTEGRPCCAPGC